jgi:hypothetical protein
VERVITHSTVDVPVNVRLPVDSSFANVASDAAKVNSTLLIAHYSRSCLETGSPDPVSGSDTCVEQFTFDVVYKEEDLVRAFRLKNINPRRDLARSFGIITNGYWRPHVFFHARSQTIHYTRSGITNGELLECISKAEQGSMGATVWNLLRKLFSQMSSSGDSPSQYDLLSFHDDFDRFFLPFFEMRKIIYSQCLEVLQLLMRHVLKRYQFAAVNYVEFSVGFMDLTSPWVYKHLTCVPIAKDRLRYPVPAQISDDVDD